MPTPSSGRESQEKAGEGTVIPQTGDGESEARGYRSEPGLSSCSECGSGEKGERGARKEDVGRAGHGGAEGRRGEGRKGERSREGQEFLVRSCRLPSAAQSPWNRRGEGGIRSLGREGTDGLREGIRSGIKGKTQRIGTEGEPGAGPLPNPLRTEHQESGFLTVPGGREGKSVSPGRASSRGPWGCHFGRAF